LISLKPLIIQKWDWQTIEEMHPATAANKVLRGIREAQNQ
jgi:hypothetical protein